MAFTDITVDAAIIILVGPYRAGKTADDSTDHRAFENADAGDQRTGTGTDSTANQCTGGNAAKRRIIALRLTRIILAFADISVSIAVLILVGPNRARQPANGGTYGGALDWSDTSDDCADRGTTGRADGRPCCGGLKRPVIICACAE